MALMILAGWLRRDGPAKWQAAVEERRQEEAREEARRKALAEEIRTGQMFLPRELRDLQKSPRVQQAFNDEAIRAAARGDAESAKRNLRGIIDPAAKDEATYQAALALGTAGKRDEAVNLAKTLSTPDRQNQALSGIDRGDQPRLPVRPLPPHLRPN